MSLNLYLAYIAACIALALLPGPIVTLLIANGLRYGTRAALINILGAQAGLVIVIGIVSIGLTSMIATMGYWFNWVRLAGAVYLIWLGIKLIRFPVEGINPKLLVFFGAFIPQFIDMKGDHASQVTLLGATFMVVAGVTDGAYALLAGRARTLFSAPRTQLVSRISGGFMIGGGVWLALTRAR